MASHNAKSSYITEASTLTRTRTNSFVIALTVFLSFTVMFQVLGVSGIIEARSTAAFADTEDDFRGDASDYINEGEDGEGVDGFFNTINRARNETDRNSFGFIFSRMFSLGYMNWVPEATKDKPPGELNCDVNNSAAGTAMYHNCDVPNILTDLLQSVLSNFIPTGPSDAEVTEAKVPFGFGIPSNIPGSTGVPVTPAERGTVKYTALEIYGYNLKYTSYKGEWDHIEVMTSSRMLANFGFMDKVKLGINAVVNGVVAGANAAWDSFAEGISNGDVIGAVGNAVSSFFSSGSSAAVNTVVDDSDNNVFQTYGWYRQGYSPTLYNARELSQEEQAVFLKLALVDIFSGEPDAADVPEDLAAIAAGPPRPVEAISKCSAKKSADEDDVYHEVLFPGLPAGPSEADCDTSAANPPYEDDSPKWEAEGTQKKELLADWIATNESTFNAATAYGITCVMDTNEGTRAANIESFYKCWDPAYQTSVRVTVAEKQKENNKNWFLESIQADMIQEAFKKNPRSNTNAPWMRFVCTENDGTDMKSSGGSAIKSYVFLFDADTKELNPKCNPVRPPIQNGLFGNGYDVPYKDGKEAVAGIDTRREAMPDIGAYMFIDLNFIPNFGLNIAKGFTQLSNLILDLSFVPIMTKLGLKDIIVELIGGFRDSIYYPFLILVIAVSGLTVLLRAGRNRDYSKSFVDIGLIIGTFMMGVMLLHKPDTVVKLVDEVPAKVETAIMGSVFSVGADNDDVLCSATGASGGTVENLTGGTIDFSPEAAVRTMECEVWKAFAFNPWVEGQFGTSYQNLEASKMQNTNGALVGNASVKFNSTVSANNWALYQLDLLSSGTATTSDPSTRTGIVPRDFYRLVDLQAGPANGKWSPEQGASPDSRYFQTWSGQDQGYRMLVGLMAPLSAIIGFVTILVYAFIKIEITIITALMLLLMPFMMLVGVHPTWGRMKLKSWIGTIIGLMMQRVMLVTLLAIMLKMITSIQAGAPGNYKISTLMTVVTCCAFLLYRKPIMNMITQSASSAAGGVMAEGLMNNPNSTIKSSMPKSVQNATGMARATAIGVTSGSIAGYMHGGLKGARKGAQDSVKFNRNSIRNKQRRSGLGALSKIQDATREGQRAAKGGIRDIEKKRKATEKTMETSVNERNVELEFDPNSAKLKPVSGSVVSKPGEEGHVPINFEKPGNSRLLNEFVSLDEEIGKLENEKREIDRTSVSPDQFKDKSGKVNVAELNKYSEDRTKKVAAIDSKIKAKELEKSVVVDELHKKNDYAGWLDRKNKIDETNSAQKENEEYTPEPTEAPTRNSSRRDRRKAEIEKMRDELFEAKENLVDSAHSVKDAAKSVAELGMERVNKGNKPADPGETANPDRGYEVDPGDEE